MKRPCHRVDGRVAGIPIGSMVEPVVEQVGESLGFSVEKMLSHRVDGRVVHLVDGRVDGLPARTPFDSKLPGIPSWLDLRLLYFPNSRPSRIQA